MVVAGFRRVGGVVLGALGPVDVVVRGRGVWSCWGFPSEHELASVVVGGGVSVYGSCCRSCIFRGRFFLDRVFFSRLLDRCRGGRLRRLSGHRDGGFFPWATPGFAHVLAFVVASTHADLVLGVVG